MEGLFELVCGARKCRFSPNHKKRFSFSDKKGRIDLPYRLELKDPHEMVRSHIYIEKKVLAMFRKIKNEFMLYPWLREALNYTIDAKAKNL